MVVSLTGVGIETMIYIALVLLYRADLKIAIPTAVTLIAFTSVVGIASNLLLARFAPLYAISPEVFYNWLAAAPVVVLCAPIGALVVNRLPRKPTLIIVSLLCMAQFVWALAEAEGGSAALAAAVAGVLAANVGFHFLYRWGRRSQGKDEGASR
jgi:uncharacterized membrane protein YfcA